MVYKAGLEHGSILFKQKYCRIVFQAKILTLIKQACNLYLCIVLTLVVGMYIPI